MGRLLVILEFGILASLLVWSIRQGSQPVASAVPITLLAASLIIGAWVVVANKPGNFNILPTPRTGGSLITRGPYRWIRHPMYTSVLLFGLACATVINNSLGWATWMALSTALWSKVRMKEKYLMQVYKEYEAYMANTRRFIAWIF